MSVKQTYLSMNFGKYILKKNYKYLLIFKKNSKKNI